MTKAGEFSKEPANIWCGFDEEPPDPAEGAEAQAEGSGEIWTECLLRIMTTEYGVGLLMATFTPLRGMTPFLKQYLESCVMPGTEDETDDVPAVGHFFPEHVQLGGESA